MGGKALGGVLIVQEGGSRPRNAKGPTGLTVEPLGESGCIPDVSPPSLLQS